jgi:hypothetical protein
MGLSLEYTKILANMNTPELYLVKFLVNRKELLLQRMSQYFNEY